MVIPSYPANLVPQPFAAGGNFQVIPDTKQNSGRASYREGFPTETQQPLNQGGIAPNRLDFNGLFHLLTAFAHWQQSGGQWVYSTTLNYTVPNIVFHNGQLWWCVAGNGPDTSAGLKEPGTDAAYWLELLQQLAQGGGGSAGGLNPVGTVIMYAAVTAPDGYFVCDGSTFSPSENPVLYGILGSNILPDMRGLFVRGYDPSGVNDANGVGRGIRSAQGDAIRNIYGDFCGAKIANSGVQHIATGPFAVSRFYDGVYGGGGRSTVGLNFNASRVVPTADENRPKNINLLYCIKHD